MQKARRRERERRWPQRTQKGITTANPNKFGRFETNFEYNAWKRFPINFERLLFWKAGQSIAPCYYGVLNRPASLIKPQKTTGLRHRINPNNKIVNYTLDLAPARQCWVHEKTPTRNNASDWVRIRVLLKKRSRRGRVLGRSVWASRRFWHFSRNFPCCNFKKILYYSTRKKCSFSVSKKIWVAEKKSPPSTPQTYGTVYI